MTTQTPTRQPARERTNYPSRGAASCENYAIRMLLGFLLAGAILDGTGWLLVWIFA